jgi:hypothetical protein
MTRTVSPEPIHSPLLLSMGVRDREILGWIQSKAPVYLAMALQPIRAAKKAALAEQMERVSRIGRDHLGVVDKADYGHSIRQIAVRDHNGTAIREADVEIAAQADLSNPNRVVRRARRTDSLLLLRQGGAISEVEYRAGEMLRDDMERGQTSMAAGTEPSSRPPPWGRIGINAEQIRAIAAVRAAMATVDESDRLALLWLLAGGSVNGFVRYKRCDRARVTSSICRGLVALAKHYGLLPGGR